MVTAPRSSTAAAFSRLASTNPARRMVVSIEPVNSMSWASV